MISSKVERLGMAVTHLALELLAQGGGQFLILNGECGVIQCLRIVGENGPRGHVVAVDAIPVHRQRSVGVVALLAVGYVDPVGASLVVGPIGRCLLPHE